MIHNLVQEAALKRNIIGALLACSALVAAWPAAAQADLPGGSFVFDGAVRAITHAADGSVYVGGDFAREQAATGSGIVVPSGSGIPDPSAFPHVVGTVAAAVTDGSGGYYIGGYFTNVGGLPRANVAHVLASGAVDPAWHPDTDGEVNALAISGSHLYVGGWFSSIGGVSRNDLADVDAASAAVSAWDPEPNDVVSSLAATASTVYVGGFFSSIAGQTRNTLAAIDAGTGLPTSWDPEADGPVYAIAPSGSTVYVGGSFTSIGGQPRANLAALDSTTAAATDWNPGPNGNGGQVSAIAISGPVVYVGGTFTAVGGQQRYGLAALDGSGDVTSWNPLTGVSRVNDLAVSGTTVYAVGSLANNRAAAAFSTTTGIPSGWTPAPNGSADAVAVSGSTVYVGGNFSGAGPALASVQGVAKLDAAGSLNTAWAPNPTGGQVAAVAVSRSTVYIGGQFTSIAGQPQAGLGAVDTGTGSLIAASLTMNAGAAVDVIAVAGTTVYVGGRFASIGGQARKDLVAIDSTTNAPMAWNPSPAGGPASGIVGVMALAPTSSGVYVSGSFTSIGGQPRAGLAQLDITTGNASRWDPNPNGIVRALVASGPMIYAGGDFTQIGGQARAHLAAVGTANAAATPWNPGPDGTVEALRLAGASLYVGGSFDHIGSSFQYRYHLAAVSTDSGDATNWNPDLGPKNGQGDVSAVDVAGPSVFAGGSFASVGNQVTGAYAQFGGDPGAGGSGVPIEISEPVITGEAIIGQTLTESHGSWSSAPTSYSYLWMRCDSTVNGCVGIPGATSPTYTITTADLGHTMLVLESATNTGGTSEWAGSQPTSVVRTPSPEHPGGGTGATPGSAAAGAGTGDPGAVTPGTTSTGAGASISPGAGGAAPSKPSEGGGGVTLATAQLRKLLLRVITPGGKASKIGQLLKKRTYTVKLAAPVAGTAVVRWYARINATRHTRATRVLVATGVRRFDAPGSRPLTVRLTTKGTRVLAHVDRLTVSVLGSFSAPGRPVVTTTRSAILRR